MILVFAGRRIDAAATPATTPGDDRFPLYNVPRVSQAIERALIDSHPSTVVGAAACGADLLVLEAAGRLGIRRRIVLPFDRAAFRASSVIDRPGDWGPRFDAVIAAVSAAGDLIERDLDPEDEATYVRGNLEIISDADGLARDAGEACRALVIWNRVSRGPGDVTEAFRTIASEDRGWPVIEIDTLD